MLSAANVSPFSRTWNRDQRMNLRGTLADREREFFIDNLLVGIHFIIVMIRWTDLAPWES